MCVRVHPRAHASSSMYAILWLLFLPSAFTWALGFKLRPLGLHDKCLYPLSHRTILRFIEFLPLFLQLGALSYLSS